MSEEEVEKYGKELNSSEATKMNAEEGVDKCKQSIWGMIAAALIISIMAAVYCSPLLLLVPIICGNIFGKYRMLRQFKKIIKNEEVVISRIKRLFKIAKIEL